MTYIDAHHDRENDVILVSERVNGKRRISELPPVYEFYYESENGNAIGTSGERAKLVTCKRFKDFQKELRTMAGRKLFESDHNIIFKTLKRHFLNSKPADLHVAFFDIETDFDLKKGYSTPEDPFNPVTAVSVFQSWTDNLITLVIKPDTLSTQEAEKICSQFENTILCATEKELLMLFQELIEDADVISGWNSEGYDVPYMINRTIQEIGKTATAGWCLFGMQPVKTKYEKFGKEQLSFTLKGRLHIDYLDLYKKHTPKTQESYKLDFIGLQEVGEQKVQYEGTLYQLYREDFYKFIDYNRQDTILLSKIDKKLRYLDLANQIANQNYVLIPSTMGTVAWVDQSIINEAHERGMVVPTKPREEEQTSSAAGAWVADPEFGLHEWIGAIDINSLYPSAIRLLNMSPETIVAQIRDDFTQEFLEDRINRENLIVSVKGIRVKNYTEAWGGLFGTLEYNMVLNKDDTELTVDYCDGSTQTISAADLYGMIFQEDSGLNISANGTIFRTDIDGLIPGLLARWYNERKEMQAKAKEFKVQAEHETDPVKKAELMRQFSFWNMRQQIRKIQLNSLYGSLLQKGSKFYDKRMGQSVTLTGRCITRHMTAKVNEIVTGVYDYEGDVVISGDTDSVYFSTWNFMQKNNIDFSWKKEDVIELYDEIAAETNRSFPEKMHELFHSGLERGGIIQAGRELVGTRGLFVAKKRYAILVYDNEGFREDQNGKPGKMKVMGLDIKRADSSKTIQNFLEDCMLYVLTGGDETGLRQKIQDFRMIFKNLPPWEKGSPKSANKMSFYTDELKKKGSAARLPGHVRASVNWNQLCDMNNDQYATRITDGSRIVVCKLKQNPLNTTSIAYPVDEVNLPKWFKTLPFDDDAMEASVVEKKLHNIFEILGWDLHIGEAAHSQVLNSMFEF